MTAQCRSSAVTALLECHQSAWNEFNAAWVTAPSDGAPECVAEKLTDVHSDLNQTAPVITQIGFAFFAASTLNRHDVAKVLRVFAEGAFMSCVDFDRVSRGLPALPGANGRPRGAFGAILPCVWHFDDP